MCDHSVGGCALTKRAPISELEGGVWHGPGPGLRGPVRRSLAAALPRAQAVGPRPPLAPRRKLLQRHTPSTPGDTESPCHPPSSCGDHISSPGG